MDQLPRARGEGRPIVLNVFEGAFETSPLAQLVINGDGALSVASPKAHELLQLPTGAEGLPFEALARECEGPELASLVARAYTDDTPMSFAGQCWTPRNGPLRRLNGGILPLHDREGHLLGTTVTLEPADTGEMDEHTNELRRDVSELRSINDELRLRTDELNLVAIFLESVLTSLRGAVVVVDKRLTVRVWNPQAERLWSIPRRSAMGTRLPELDLRVGYDEIAPCVDAALRGEVDVDELVVRVRRGDAVSAYVVSATPLLGPGGTVHGATLLFVERPDKP
jgi:PAS domain-containing protein